MGIPLIYVLLRVGTSSPRNMSLLFREVIIGAEIKRTTFSSNQLPVELSWGLSGKALRDSGVCGDTVVPFDGIMRFVSHKLLG
jgi:hypothetical protein